MTKKNKSINFIFVLLILLFALNEISFTNTRLVGRNDYSELKVPSISNTPLVWNREMPENIRSVAISSNGTFIAAGCDDNRIYCFNKSSSTPLWFYDVGGNVYEVAISLDECYIAVAAANIYMFNITNIASPFLWSYPVGGQSFRSVAISANGSYVVAGCSDNRVYLFNGTNNANPYLWSTSPTEGDINDISISSDGNYMVAICRWSGDTIYAFQKSSSTPMWTYQESGFVPVSVEISADGQFVIAHITNMVSEVNKIHIFNTTNNVSPLLWPHTLDTDDFIATLSISFNGDYFVACGNWRVRLFNKSISSPTWNNLWEATIEAASVVKISADGNYIIAGSGNENKKVYLFHKSHSSSLWSYPIRGLLDYNQLAISSDGEYIVTGCTDTDQVPNEHNLFLLTRGLPQIIVSNGGSDGGGNGGSSDSGVIPFGNYYILFMVLGIILLITHIKRKVVFKTN